ncbi:uncharacterized protein LOC123528146 [Mercenaria mercenaria]|uniref:uncharacterized protein LOC123528146 n=1 Tax=Mercenaria mercenaria TaxID=6596 RepID=UPI00234F43C3|nr:uncharacterized protein LOC123528146 [Mercenaria mercenaria]
MDDKLKSFFDVVGRLLDHDKKIASLMEQLQDAKAIIETMNRSQSDLSAKGSQTSVLSYAANTYTRWGRSTCPGNATLVYEGFAAGSDHSHKGAAVNHLCLPRDPNWNNNTKTPSALALIYGGEYETFNGIFHTLHDHDVPCAVCRVPRTNIIMVPGKNACYQNYVLEYKGYLMAGHYGHPASTEYVCVDGEPEKARNSIVSNHNGVLFYFVRAKCGSLKCPPYKEDDDLTCVVCSFSP